MTDICPKCGAPLDGPIGDAKHESFRRMYFASVREAWLNLPEDLSRFKSPDHLRYWILIETGFCNEDSRVYETIGDALRTYELLEQIAPVQVSTTCSGNVVKIWTAKSQKRGAMTKEEFKASANAVLDRLAELIGTSVNTLKHNAGRAA